MEDLRYLKVKLISKISKEQLVLCEILNTRVSSSSFASVTKEVKLIEVNSKIEAYREALDLINERIEYEESYQRCIKELGI